LTIPSTGEETEMKKEFPTIAEVIQEYRATRGIEKLRQMPRASRPASMSLGMATRAKSATSNGSLEPILGISRRCTAGATVLRPLPVFTAMSATNAFKFSF
jgi:hypothetical protein